MTEKEFHGLGDKALKMIKWVKCGIWPSRVFLTAAFILWVMMRLFKVIETNWIILCTLLGIAFAIIGLNQIFIYKVDRITKTRQEFIDEIYKEVLRWNLL